ncbi:MAG TPA: hypothetical protein VGF13_17180 [Verrucomicrobiae bacterium]|jgi:hypothetical protein
MNTEHTRTQIAALAVALEFSEGTKGYTPGEIVETAAIAIHEIEQMKEEAQKELNESN